MYKIFYNKLNNEVNQMINLEEFPECASDWFSSSCYSVDREEALPHHGYIYNPVDDTFEEISGYIEPTINIDDSPTEVDKLRADIDYLAIITGVEL